MQRESAVETWDAYLEDGTLAGCDLIRGEAIPRGLFHLVSEVVVRHRDGSILLMQRDYGKEVYPGLYEVGAGGSALKGETPDQAARRELLEETGIVAGELQPIYRCVGENAIYHGYLCETDWDKQRVTLQEHETIDFQWLSPGEFLEKYWVRKEPLAHTKRLGLVVDILQKNRCGSERDCPENHYKP